jgi:hypothetical protein
MGGGRPMRVTTDLEAAATWNRIESIDATNARIHDVVVGDERLRWRAETNVARLLFAAAEATAMAQCAARNAPGAA